MHPFQNCPNCFPRLLLSASVNEKQTALPSFPHTVNHQDLPSNRKTACLRKILTRVSSRSTSCSLAMRCSSLRHTFSWAYSPSGMILCWPSPIRAVSTARARYDSPSSKKRRVDGNKCSSLCLLELIVLAAEGEKQKERKKPGGGDTSGVNHRSETFLPGTGS